MRFLHPSFATMVFLAFTAVDLAIRGGFARRVRRDKAVSKADLRDRLLILVVGIGRVVVL